MCATLGGRVTRGTIQPARGSDNSTRLFRCSLPRLAALPSFMGQLALGRRGRVNFRRPIKTHSTEALRIRCWFKLRGGARHGAPVEALLMPDARYAECTGMKLKLPAALRIELYERP